MNHPDGERRARQPGGTAGIWRAIDASANRAGEALRVVEDMARFVLDDAALTSLAKNLRHDLAALLAADTMRGRAALRDAGADVGAGLEAAARLDRASVADLVAANAARAAQALRSLEECVAAVGLETAGGFSGLRYRLYTLERGLLSVARARARLAGVNLCVLVDGRAGMPAFERLLESLLEAGVRMFQIRDKSAGVPALVERVRLALAIVRRRNEADPALVIVNDRVDLAAALGADDLPTALVRRVLGPGPLLGRTAHDVAEARAAAAEAADYLGIGPCFPSATKSFGAFAPPAFLRTVATEIGLPAFAIGGVTLERVDALTALGIRRVAVASAVTGAADPAAAARAMIERLGDGADDASGR